MAAAFEDGYNSVPADQFGVDAKRKAKPAAE
jgi:hypothetical protein